MLPGWLQILLLLLEKSPAKRLGVSDSVAGDIRTQPFFKPIDFAKLEKKQIAPPYKPKLVWENKNSLFFSLR